MQSNSPAAPPERGGRRISADLGSTPANDVVSHFSRNVNKRFVQAEETYSSASLRLGKHDPDSPATLY